MRVSCRKNGRKYRCGKTEYARASRTIFVTCPKHGDFRQTTKNHLLRGHGCPVCGGSSEESKVARALERLRAEFAGLRSGKQFKLSQCAAAAPFRLGLRAWSFLRHQFLLFWLVFA